MKKLTTVLLTLTFVFGVAAMSSAACFNCAGEAANIARGCDSSQEPGCEPFDFETVSDYCDTKTPNRALFKICDCIPEIFDTIEAGDTIDISMEILVDSGNGEESGDNGVYWAEEVDSIALGTYNNQTEACKDSGYGEWFDGPFKFLLADGEEGGVDESNVCDIADDDRVVKFVPDRALAAEQGGTTGYMITDNDDYDDRATWAIDIPEMRVDNSMIVGGEKVWVKICLSRYTGGICEELPCCCLIYIGELCCESIRQSSGLVYPYFPKANQETWNLIGMTITNLEMVDGSATITMYETDGTVGTLTVPVAANSIYLNTLASIIADPGMVVSGTGVLGDAISYMVVTTDFDASGFVMIADTIDGASMGYLPTYGYK
ncbi:MAG: hypothetical protein C4518_19645 [Desulfobacteraceae bacterium]|nr:MAG: hypothetical protein C4518_19645 [Desulfobacteraceae bacterium]